VPERLAWGLIAAGRIARTFAKDLARSRTGRLLAVGSRSAATAQAFGQEFGAERCHGSYEALLDDADVQAVYISTPHPMHAEWAVKAADAGKHILCEKPIALNHAEAMAIVEAARRNDVFLMEAFMYRCHPQTARLVALLRQKVIGDVRVIHATFSFRASFDPQSRLFANALGGGGILDVGCYCASLARLIAGVAAGRDFAEPIEVRGVGHLGPTGVDEYAAAVLKFPGHIVASVATGVTVQQDNVVRIFGTEGSIVVPSPWMPTRDGGAGRILVYRNGRSEPEETVIESQEPLYAIEADTVALNLDRRQAPPPAMSWDDTLGNMKTLDRWRDAIGLLYDAEKPDANVPTVDHRPLRAREASRMRYGQIRGVAIPVSRLVMGVDNQTTLPHASVVFDDYFARGGNCFDTAYVYGGGLNERLLGQWVRNRGIRDKVIVLGKGAHTPYCTPSHLTRQLLESLDRLQTDHVDVYMLHRDSPDVPVGEFVDVLNEHLRAGRVRALGASNWTTARIDAANTYAASKGLAGFAAISNQWSLARMVAPPWGGCIAADAGWHRRTQMPLMPWSSTARGFFAQAADPSAPVDPELVRCWHCADNFRRLERAKELAARRNVAPVVVALAYVLCQTFPTFALVGPRTLAETRVAFQALDLELSADELRWLDLEA
jgi:predicted dehydrogenase/aryl-alcohol dehydrogenase-like predicted oxidoreductase